MGNTEKLAELIQKSSHTVVLSGAGISTLSGIPDFRSPGGLYSQLDAEKIFDLHYFLKDQSYYYTNSEDFIYGMDAKDASIVHHECARLEQLGLIKAIITQNIDLLHQKAGSKNVIEIHGSPMQHHCLACNKSFSYEWVQNLVRKDQLPKCDYCAGAIKPDIVFFGEMLPVEALEEAHAQASQADLMLVLGSSLMVHPAASIPIYTVQNGGKLVIVNREETPLDSYAEFRLDDLESCFNQLARLIPG